MAKFSFARDAVTRVNDNFGPALELYAEQRIGNQSVPVVPGEFLDTNAANRKQHGLTGLFLWDYFLRTSGISEDRSGAFESAGQLGGHLRSLIEALAQDQPPPAALLGETLNWAKLSAEFTVSTSKRCLFLLTLSANEQVVAEIKFLCAGAVRAGALYGWRAKLGGGAEGPVEHMLTAYVLALIGDAAQPCGAAIWDDLPEERKVVEGAARLVWNHYQKISRGTGTAKGFRSDSELRCLFLLNTLYRLQHFEIVSEGNGLEFTQSETIRRISHIIESVYILSQGDPLHIGSDITYFYKDFSVDSDRYIRINGDVLLLEGMLFAYGAHEQTLKTSECRRLIDRVTMPFDEKFSEDANGQRFAVYAAYHALRALSLLGHLSEEPARGWGVAAKLRYYWHFRRGLVVDLGWTALGFLLAGVFYFASLFEPALFAFTVPCIVLGVTSLVRGLGVMRVRQ